MLDQTNPLRLLLQASMDEFERYRKLADGALAQVGEADWFIAPVEGANPLAHLVKHVGANLHSRWTDFLTSDGDIPERRRDLEFETEEEDSVARLLEQWHLGWATLRQTLTDLTDADLGSTVTIRGQPHTVHQAIQRSLGHTAYHVGQIVFLAKQLRGGDFQNLTIARGKSEEYYRSLLKP
jgi:uncharacterized damage-inducible protein DinB